MPQFLIVLYCVVEMVSLAFSIQCYECSYANNTLPPEARILGMIPTQTCLNLNPGHSNTNVLINSSCKLGCKSTNFVQGGMQLVLRGCLQPSSTPCSNYTTPTMSETCCTSDLCNHGPVGQGVPERRKTVKCYQCVGSTRNQDKFGTNKYADKYMRISEDCMDDKFNPSGKYVELNETCESGCLTGIITDKQGIVYVNRGCASTHKFKCVSGTMSGEQTNINRNLDSIVQKCCTAHYCNVGDIYSIVKSNSTTIFQKPTVTEHSKNITTTRSVVGLSTRTRSFEWLLGLTFISCYTFS